MTPCPGRLSTLLGAMLLSSVGAMGDTVAQWGQFHSRNMVSAATGLPAAVNPNTGKNIRWSVRLGTQTYASPVVAGNRVFIGTNNQPATDPRFPEDRGVLLCLDTADGAMQWRLAIPKRHGDRFEDWPNVGICSPPTVEGNRVYVETNRREVLCLDLEGLANGNDGPYRDEATLLADGGDPIRLTEHDPDIIWRFDIAAQAGIHPHDSAHSSILVDGPFLYLNSGNGVDNTHRHIRCPDGPSLIVLDKATGQLVARDQEGIGPRIFHCTWSPPSMAEVSGRRLVFFGGADGVCYAFAALAHENRPATVAALSRIWRFDCDPQAPKENVHQYVGNRQKSPSIISGMPVAHDGRVYVAAGGDIWWGKREASLYCIDATGKGDITDSGRLWTATLNRHCCSTPAIQDGLVFIADCGGVVHCLDAATGNTVWTHQAGGEIWGSTLVADGKLYVGTRRKRLWILNAARELQILCEATLDSPINGTPTAAENGTLYVATMRRLYAFGKQR